MSDQPKRILVIYHSADFDGIFSREIARLHFGDNADYLGWNYGDAVPVVPPEIEQLYMIDISVKGLMDHPKLIWIDHHKTAMEEFPATIPGYRIEGVAACRLAWQWFSPNRPHWGGDLPTKEDFVERRVHEPLAVRLAGEYDVWDHRDPHAVLFQHGLRSQDIHWLLLLCTDEDAENYVGRLLQGGEYLAYAAKEGDAKRIKKSGFDLKWEGLTFLAVNGGGNSISFAAGVRSHHDGLLAFRWERDKWRVSLYGTPSRPDLDLSAIAKRHGGGGHRQACGFECKRLPFLGHEQMLANALRFSVRTLARAEQVLTDAEMNATAALVHCEAAQARRALEIAGETNEGA